MVAVGPPSLPALNCPVLTFSASSMPPITTFAVLKALHLQHLPQPLFDSPMVLLDQVVQVLCCRALAPASAARSFPSSQSRLDAAPCTRPASPRPAPASSSALCARNALAALTSHAGSNRTPLSSPLGPPLWTGTTVRRALLTLGLVHAPRTAHRPGVPFPALLERRRL